MTAIMEFINAIDPYVKAVDPYLGLIALIPICLTFYEVRFGRRRQHNRWFKQIIRTPGERPAILIVDILVGKEIKAQFENFRRGNEVLKNIPDDRIFRIDAASIGVTSAELSAKDMTAFARKTSDTVADMYKAGPDVVHYFHSGPLPTAALVAASLANSFRVQMYHWRQGYENWGPIRHPGGFQ